MDNEAESQVVGMVNAAAAPLAMEGGAPATTLWWDGIVVAANIRDEEAETAFRVAMEGLDTEMVTGQPGRRDLAGARAMSRTAWRQGAIATATATPGACRPIRRPARWD